jgi:uncharacterized protein YjlB
MAIVTQIPAFRAAFPEFAATSVYPDGMIAFWASVAEAQVRQRAWGGQWQNGVYLYIAHEITLAAQAQKTAKFGGAPGTFGGVANTKTVGGSTVGYDAATTTEKDAGYWNLTNYGKQFIRLARIYGAGAAQL